MDRPDRPPAESIRRRLRPPTLMEALKACCDDCRREARALSRRGRPNRCVTCAVVLTGSEYGYRLRDGVWERLYAEEGELLCIGCVEHRLGRRLVVRDFDWTSEINHAEHRRSRRLKSRMGDGAFRAEQKLLKLNPWMAEEPHARVFFRYPIAELRGRTARGSRLKAHGS